MIPIYETQPLTAELAAVVIHFGEVAPRTRPPRRAAKVGGSKWGEFLRILRIQVGRNRRKIVL